MSNPKSLNDFQQNYCTTLITEPNSDSFFVKIPVTGYDELSILKTNLLTAIKLISDYNEVSTVSLKSEVTHSIGTLIQLLRNFGLQEECEGLTQLMKKNR